MKVIDVTKAQASLARYARRVHRDGLLIAVAEHGRAIAVVVAVHGQDIESPSLLTNPQFIGLIEASRKRCPPGSGVSMDELRGRLTARKNVSARG